MRSNMAGVGPRNSEYRRFNRSFGRGAPKPFQPSEHQLSPPPTRRGDLFIEAGRLAVEYLVSHGLLSSNVLSGKPENGILRNNSRDFQHHRSSESREILSLHVDGRFRQRAASPEGVSGIKKSPNDQEPSMSRDSHLRERRRFGTSRSYNSEWSHENEKESSLSDKVTASEGMEAYNDKFSKDISNNADGSCLGEFASNDDRNSQFQDETAKCSPCDDSDSKTSSVLLNNDIEERPKPSDGVDAGCEETRNGTRDLNQEKGTSRDEMVVEHREENMDATKDCKDLLKLCPPTEIPTDDHSSLTNKSPSSDRLMLGDGHNTSYIGCDSLKSTKDVTMNGSSEVPLSNGNDSSKCVGRAVSEHSFRNAGALDPACAADEKKTVESLSFTDKTFSYEQKSDGLPELESLSKDRGEKRPFEDESMGEGAKRAKQWLSVAQSGEYSQLSDLSDKQLISQANRSAPVNIFNSCANQERFDDVSLPLKGSVESTVEQGEEKQLFSSSFKICDLNLMGASDMHENHDISGLLYPSISASNKKAAVHVDLSMSNNYSLNSGYNDHGAARKDIEIIDLESTSLQEARSMENTEGDITNMGGFPNNPQNCNDNPDGQDGYGFMISELLGNDVPNCSSVQPHVHSLHNDMGLHHGEGIFSEDDQIYMSLGEIPISLLRGWEQPTQERNPFEL